MWLAVTGLSGALIAAAAMGVACSLLSVFVVLRRWAFIGEGIAHAGFGGAGTAWVLCLLFPGVPFFASDAGIYSIAVVFCIGVAVAVAWTTRRDELHLDTAMGIFLVASLAWGFLAYRLYRVKMLREPPGWGEYLFGQLGALSAEHVVGAVCVCAAVVLVVVVLAREIIYCSFDPAMAEASGVRVGLMHYLLIVMMTLTIVIGMKLMGSVLVTALLVLPGATGLRISRRLGAVLAASVAVGLLGALGGSLVSARWPDFPAGPAIVMALVVEFGAVCAWRRVVYHVR
jgi:ABC-type Mn2+/Zn2+ transport system permease subunit